jgi:hypothetical protein
VVKEVVGLSPGVDVLSHGDVIVEVNRQATPHAADYKKGPGRPEGRARWPGSSSTGRGREATFLAKVEVEKKRPRTECRGEEGPRKGAHREPEAEGARRGRRGGHPVVRCG